MSIRGMCAYSCGISPDFSQLSLQPIGFKLKDQAIFHAISQDNVKLSPLSQTKDSSQISKQKVEKGYKKITTVG